MKSIGALLLWMMMSGQQEPTAKEEVLVTVVIPSSVQEQSSNSVSQLVQQDARNVSQHEEKTNILHVAAYKQCEVCHKFHSTRPAPGEKPEAPKCKSGRK